MDKKFFFFDIDGTLASGLPAESHISDLTKYTIQKLKENGHFVAIATGRSHAMAESLMDIFNIDNMVHDGGNGITIDRKLLYIEPLNYDDCVAVINECKEKGYPWGFSPDNTKRRLCPDGSFMEATHDVYLATEVKEGLDPLDYDEIYKVYVACHYPEEFEMESLKKLPWCRYDPEYFFVEPTNKAKGIRKIIEHFGGKTSDVVVFGDGLNDLSMFIKDEWTCIAMGNGHPDLKAAATYVTESVFDDGVYKACKKFGWID